MRALALGLAFVLVGCATTCPAPSTARTDYDRLYALEGQVASDVAQGRITGQQALALNAELNRAHAALRSGVSAAVMLNQIETQLRAEETP
jgi:hypothetical protein